MLQPRIRARSGRRPSRPIRRGPRPPRRRRPEERPHELLAAALRVFAARGYRNARLEEVAAAAGVTKGAVYHYFADKEDLLVRALAQHQERALGRLEQAIRGEPDTASARLRRFVRKAFGGEDAARDDVLVLLQDIRHEAPAVYRRWIADGPVKGWRLVASLIEAGKATGEFRPDVDSEVAARLVVTGLLGQVVLQRHARQVPAVRIGTERLVESALELLLAGLRRGSAGGRGPRPRRASGRGRQGASRPGPTGAPPG